ncbi:uncharacterized protein BDR25DRAFT_112349 [Lindgomyces ingoldianus]|uniref:Uncharacterized protein n=1 Tax=Lindgomyces ingoldianus TaxID=673940 RepID=A0ACB6R6X3_9PLEO|nr:uncharacterized protein BDR25DRAFT_112349 [Lindgomyces ingoldianus]KAF2474827.1 hypothetical protein BDR25DRAFT_112349 [Lindgomyces ingoldianus]
MMTHLDHINDDVESTHEGLTALPKWEGIRIPNRPPIQKGSRGLMLNDGFMKEILGARPRSSASDPAEEENPKHSRMMIWLVLMLVILLALAIVLGAVLGTFLNPSGQSRPPNSSVTDIPAVPTPTSGIASPNGTRPPSLAVTGWNVAGPSGYFTVWLFSQDSKGFLSRSTFNSSTGNWTRVSHFSTAKRGSPLTATALNSEYYANQGNYSFSGIQYQAEVVYLNDLNYVSEWIFPDNGPTIGQPGSLDQQRYTASESSNLAFYWPKLVYQGLGGELRGVNFECHKKNQCWHDSVLRSTEPSNGTRLALVPLTNNLSSTALFYRQEDGSYVNYKEDGGQASVIWRNRAFSGLVPADSSLAAFSTTRPGKTVSSLNTYLLWQDKNGTMQVSWSDTDEGWKGPVTHPAFDGADKNTAITCLTGLTFPNFPLPVGSELSRCYFQARGSVREVSFNGTSWDTVGNVPIDI